MIASWTEANLAVQGYCLTAEEARAQRWGLRFPTALCLALVVTGLVLQSALLILAMVPIGVVAGWTRRHPFDLIWNHGVRYLSGPRSCRSTGGRGDTPSSSAPHGCSRLVCCSPSAIRPPRWCSAAFSFAVCGLVTATNFCIPSTLLGIWWRRHGAGTATTQPS